MTEMKCAYYHCRYPPVKDLQCCEMHCDTDLLTVHKTLQVLEEIHNLLRNIKTKEAQKPQSTKRKAARGVPSRENRGFEQGAAEMRRRAADIAEKWLPHALGAGYKCAKAIRALSLKQGDL